MAWYLLTTASNSHTQLAQAQGFIWQHQKIYLRWVWSKMSLAQYNFPTAPLKNRAERGWSFLCYYFTDLGHKWWKDFLKQRLRWPSMWALPSVNWPNLFVNPFRIFITDRSYGKDFFAVMVAGCEMFSFCVVKAVSCQGPPKTKPGVSVWEPWCCCWGGGCSNDKDQVSMCSATVEKSVWERNGNLENHSPDTWAKVWTSCRGSERLLPWCTHLPWAGHFISNLELQREARISQVTFCMIFQVCVSPLNAADTPEKEPFLIDSQ